MADALTIRRAGAADKVPWMLLWQGWQEHMGCRVPDQVSERSWHKIIAGGSGLFALMAWDGSKALGFANVSVTPFAWTAEDILFLQDLYVSPEARGRGVGSALLNGVYAEADRLEAHQVFWMVDEADPELQGFYDRHGVRSPYVRYLRGHWPW